MHSCCVAWIQMARLRMEERSLCLLRWVGCHLRHFLLLVYRHHRLAQDSLLLQFVGTKTQIAISTLIDERWCSRYQTFVNSSNSLLLVLYIYWSCQLEASSTG